MNAEGYGKSARFRLPVAFDTVFPPPVMPALHELMITPDEIVHTALLVREEHGCSDDPTARHCMRSMMIEQFWNNLADEVENGNDYRDLLEQHLPEVNPIFDGILDLVDTYFPVESAQDKAAPAFLGAYIQPAGDGLVVELNWDDEY